MDTEKQRLEERLLHLLQYEQGQYLRVMIDLLTDLVQHFAYRGSSHRRKGAARLNLYGLAMSLAYLSGKEEEGKGVGQHPVVNKNIFFKECLEEV